MQNLMIWATMAKFKVADFFSDEKGEVNIVAMVVLMGVAVFLAIVFRNQISDLLDTLFVKLTTSAGKVVGETPTT